MKIAVTTASRQLGRAIVKASDVGVSSLKLEGKVMSKKISLILAFMFYCYAGITLAEESSQPEHLLDGSSMNYYYQTGSAIHLELYDGKLKYKWIAGPRKGKGNKDLPYSSRKIGDKMYVIRWLEESHPDYMTLIFNFDNNVMYSSGILRFGSKEQFTVFDGGIIENLVLVEK